MFFNTWRIFSLKCSQKYKTNQKAQNMLLVNKPATLGPQVRKKYKN